MQLSDWGTRMSQKSGIRSIMDDIAAAVSGSEDDDWLNLSPGNPSAIPEVIDTWRRLATETVAGRMAQQSGNYGPSRGSDGLVDAIVRYFRNKYDWPIGPRNVLVGPGSQLLSFVATAVFTGPSPSGFRPLVLPRTPDYTGYLGYQLHDGGILGVEPRIRLEGERHFRYAMDLDALRRQEHMGMLLMSSPSNPVGCGVDPGDFAALVDIAADRDVPLLVDHAYGRPFPMVVHTPVEPVHHPRVINCFTMSKMGLPGERLAFAIGSEDLIEPMLSFVANSVLHGPQVFQSVVERALDGGEVDLLSQKVINPYYRAKRELAERLLHESMPAAVDWRMHASPGGMFVWLWIDDPRFDDLEAYTLLKQRKVFVVPGRHFFVATRDTALPRGHATRCIRLSLSLDEATIAAGIERFARTVAEICPPR